MTAEQEQINKTEGLVRAVIDMMAGRQSDFVDGEKLKKFLDNYAFIEAIAENQTIDIFLANVTQTKARFNQVSERLSGLLAAAESESDKLISQMGEGSSGLALNLANISLFQSTVADSYGSILQHLADIDITAKLNQMDSSLAESMGLIEDMRSQRTEIDALLRKVADNKALIENMDDVNSTQTSLIEDTGVMLLELEKQIENYAFYSEEFDKVYVNAVQFVEKFASLAKQIEHVSLRDDKLISLMHNVIENSSKEHLELQQIIADAGNSIEQLGLGTAQRLTEMTLFINEFNAIGQAISSFSLDFEKQKQDYRAITVELESTEFTYGK